MIQLLQLQYNYPDPMSVSNIGDSPVFFQGLNHFKHLRIFWAQQPSVGSMRESDIFVLVSLKCLSLKWSFRLYREFPEKFLLTDSLIE